MSALVRLGLFAFVAIAAHPADQIVLSGTVQVPRGQEVGEVVVLHGSVSVAGVARGDVVVLDGDIEVTGQVSGSVIAAGGSVRLGQDAQVGEDVVASARVSAPAGARVGGRVRDHASFAWRGSIEALGGFASWAAVSISTLILGALLVLLAPAGAEAAARAAIGSPLRSVGLGLAVAIALPVIAVVSIVSLVGLPLGLVLLLALALLYWIGVALAEIALGRWLWRAPRSRWLALVLGWAIGSALWLVPVLGGVTWALGTLAGLGSAAIAIRRARGTGGRHRGRGTLAPDAGVAAPS